MKIQKTYEYIKSKEASWKTEWEVTRVHVAPQGETLHRLCWWTRRYKEYRRLKKQISFKEVLKSIKKRDKLDRTRKYGPLKKTKDSILINTTKLSKKACFKKIKVIMDRKLKLNGNI